MLSEQVYEQAALLASPLEEKQETLLKLLCEGTVCALRARLREETAPEDIREDFVAAASLCAFSRWSRGQEVQEFRAGDLTVKNREADAATRCLREQAQKIIAPFLRDCFAFQGV